LGIGNVVNIHLTLVPFIKASGETKTKPTQHSVQKLREIGIQPDVIFCRIEGKLNKEGREKIALFGNVHPDAVIEGRDVGSIYEVPLAVEKEGLARIVMQAAGKFLRMARIAGVVMTASPTQLAARSKIFSTPLKVARMV
jgi:CTP synthase